MLDKVGNEVWVPHQDLAWARGVVTKAGKSMEVRMDTGGTVRANPSDCELDVGTHETVAELANITDLTKLPALHEPLLLATLQERFKQGHIYTYTGPILIAINPFKDVKMYGAKQIKEYASAPLGKEMPPHAYAVANAAFKRMVDANGTNQSILVSGESGAGKTVTTKHVMSFLTEVSGTPTTSARGEESVASKILQANPLLESFGNAKTLRNDNSSRFGKLIKMHFESNGRFLNGAQITTYLLEKARVTQQSNGERNYHVFFELLSGATPAQRSEWALPSINNCNYLNQSNTSKRSDIDDKEQFGATLNAMSVLGISPEEQTHVFQTVAAILHLGNVFFEANGQGSTVTSGTAESLEHCARLLGVAPDALQGVMCTRQIIVGRGDSEVLLKDHSVEQALDARDALAMTLYERLFGWVVWRTNSAIGAGVVFSSKASADFGSRGRVSGGAAAPVVIAKENMIGCLDVFGFEVFQTNSFEQLCINYCNEVLQKFFNEFVFEIEQAEYAKEGIDWTYVEYPDNSECIKMIDGKPIGLMSLLDEQCMFATGSDKSFASKLYDNLPKKFSSFTASQHQKVAGTFAVRHFAGDVEYTTTGFFKKNKNELRQEAVDLLVSSQDKLVSILLPPDADSAAGGADMAVYFAEVARNGGKSSSGPLVRRRSQLQQKTVGTHFKTQLARAMGTIRASEPHFVRCLKPNDEDRPMFVNPVRLVEQLRYSGVIEVIRVAKAGYPSRFSLAEFVEHFALLSKLGSKGLNPTTEAAKLIRQKNMGALRKVSQEIADGASLVHGEEFQIGKSKVFLRADTYTKLQLEKNEKVSSSVITIQRAYRSFDARNRLWKITNAKAAAKAQAAAEVAAAEQEQRAAQEQAQMDADAAAATERASKQMSRKMSKTKTASSQRPAAPSVHSSRDYGLSELTEYTEASDSEFDSEDEYDEDDDDSMMGMEQVIKFGAVFILLPVLLNMMSSSPQTMFVALGVIAGGSTVMFSQTQSAPTAFIMGKINLLLFGTEETEYDYDDDDRPTIMQKLRAVTGVDGDDEDGHLGGGVMDQVKDMANVMPMGVAPLMNMLPADALASVTDTFAPLSEKLKETFAPFMDMLPALGGGGEDRQKYKSLKRQLSRTDSRLNRQLSRTSSRATSSSTRNAPAGVRTIRKLRLMKGSKGNSQRSSGFSDDEEETIYSVDENISMSNRSERSRVGKGGRDGRVRKRDRIKNGARKVFGKKGSHGEGSHRSSQKGGSMFQSSTASRRQVAAASL